MSPRIVPRGVHCSQPPPRECEPPAGANHNILVVGKQSRISNRNGSRSISIPAEFRFCGSTLRRLGSLPSPPRQDVQLARLLFALRIRSAVLGLLRSYSKTERVRSTHNLFSCNDFSSTICNKPLTRDCSGRSIPPCGGVWKRTALSKSPNGPVAGLSPENVES